MDDNKEKDKNLDYLTKMDKTKFEILDLHDDTRKQDREYWLSKTPEERFIALELLRQRVFNYDQFTARIQRVFEIAELKHS
ncbi:unnamed protein product [Rotaria sp. Silwood1]|nr:unnamed protein product [Rotaria sp. Silwood1]CAF4873855.1 unnamed protein product [Rotaria sp. Silwood1]